MNERGGLRTYTYIQYFYNTVLIIIDSFISNRTFSFNNLLSYV